VLPARCGAGLGGPLTGVAACGRLDGHWELRLGPWDVAAGSPLVEEAGGRITDLTGGALDLDSPSLVASNGRIHAAILDVLREVGRPAETQR
jgi:myo-inositol-1(or 4)-monophosphatase